MIIARHYGTGQPVAVEIEGARFKSFTPVQVEPVQFNSLPWIAPGLIDLQINGFGGVDFNRVAGEESSKKDVGENVEDDGYVPGLDKAEAAWQTATRALYAEGCTGFLLTLITADPEQYPRLLSQWTSCLQTDPRNGLGIHMEGPWLNPEPGFRGAHPERFMTHPDLAQLDRWMEVSSGALRMMTLAPEVNLPASLEVITQLRSRGIMPFLGHSGLMGKELTMAVDAGAMGWTHLGNAAPRQADKFENVILHVLAECSLYASLIPDGIHLPEHAFRALAQSLGDHLLLTTDAMAAAGLRHVSPSMDHACTLGEVEVVLGEDGSARLPESGRLAGSTLTPFHGVLMACAMSNLPLSHLWDSYSVRPAQLLGFRHGLEVGNSADFCLFDLHENKLWATYHRGRAEYENVRP